jgi:Flp pilus assembly protein TadB
VQRLYAGEELEKALQPLAAHSPLLRRLARILERSNLAARDETQVLLEALEDLARQNRRLAEQAHVTLTVVRLTLRILTVANATIIIAAALLPTWRRHYVAQPGTYVLGSGIALVGYGYFRFKIKHLQEQL